MEASPQNTPGHIDLEQEKAEIVQEIVLNSIDLENVDSPRETFLFSGNQYFTDSDIDSPVLKRNAIKIREENFGFPVIETPIVSHAPSDPITAVIANIRELMGSLKSDLSQQSSNLEKNLKIGFKNDLLVQNENFKEDLGDLNVNLKTELSIQLEQQNVELGGKVEVIAESVNVFKSEIIPIVEVIKERSLINESKIAIVEKELNELKMSSFRKHNLISLSVSEQEDRQNESPVQLRPNSPLLQTEIKNDRRNQAAVVRMGKIPNLPTFDGNNFIPTVFLIKAEDCFNTAGVYADLDKIQAFKILIKGKVNDWLAGIKPPFTAWDDLKHNFVKQWQTPFSIQKRINEWKDLTVNKNQDIEGFVLKGLRLIEAIYPHYSFQQTIEEVITKLPWKVKEPLMLKFPAIFNEIQLLEAVQQTLRVADMAPPPQTQYREEIRPNYTNQINYEYNDNRGGENSYRNFQSYNDKYNNRGRYNRTNYRQRDNFRENRGRWSRNENEAPRQQDQSFGSNPLN